MKGFICLTCLVLSSAAWADAGRPSKAIAPPQAPPCACEKAAKPMIQAPQVVEVQVAHVTRRRARVEARRDARRTVAVVKTTSGNTGSCGSGSSRGGS